jgi:hypothetical protein
LPASSIASTASARKARTSRIMIEKTPARNAASRDAMVAFTECTLDETIP